MADRWWLVAVISALLLAPLLAVLVWLRSNDRWAPLLDQALIEMRVRDVGTALTPLVGLPGRLAPLEMPVGYGSHPGPVSFYLLAPVYRLLGSTYWALRASTVASNALAIVVALALARRRGGAPAVIAVGLALGLLELGYGSPKLTEPWNPYLPMLWFVVFLVATWCVASGDVRVLPAAGFSATYCAQTHVPYVAVCGALGTLLALVVVVSWVRARRAGVDASPEKRALGWTALSTSVLWLPPILEQCLHDPGNLSVLARYFARPPEPVLGLRGAWELLLPHFDVWHVVSSQARDPGTLGEVLRERAPSEARGLLFVGAWATSAMLAVRLASRPLLALHAVIGASLVVALLAVSRIVGPTWAYLTLWAWALGVALVVGVVATLGAAARRRAPALSRALARGFPAVGMAALAAMAVRLTVERASASSFTPLPAEQVRELGVATAAALRSHLGGTTGDRGRYLVTWSEGLDLASAVGLVNELERERFDVGFSENFQFLMTTRRVVPPGTETAELHLATGPWVRKLRGSPGATQLASSDPRTPAMRREHAELRERVIAHFRERSRPDLVRAVDLQPLKASEHVTDPVLLLVIGRMLELGRSAAVFSRVRGSHEPSTRGGS